MEEKILEKLNHLYPINIKKVISATDEMYRCIAEQGIFFARITNYKTYEEQLEKVKWTDFLHCEGLGVAPSIASVEGRIIETINLEEEKLAVLYKAAPGKHLPRNQWNASVLKELGRQIGRLHRLSKKYEKMEGTKHIKDWYENEEYNFLKYIPYEQTIIREKAREVLSMIEELPKSEGSYGLVHGDLWLENILVDSDSKISMVDFQDCEKHYYLYDLAVPIYSALEYTFEGKGNITEYGRAIIKAIIEGYQEENNMDPEILDKLPLFITLKEIFEYSLMYMYWNQQKLHEEQIRIMNHFRIRIEQNHSILPK